MSSCPFSQYVVLKLITHRFLNHLTQPMKSLNTIHRVKGELNEEWLD